MSLTCLEMMILFLSLILMLWLMLFTCILKPPPLSSPVHSPRTTHRLGGCFASIPRNARAASSVNHTAYFWPSFMVATSRVAPPMTTAARGTRTYARRRDNGSRLRRLLRLAKAAPVECGGAPGTSAPNPRPQGPLGVALVCRGARAAPTPAPALPAGVGSVRARLPAASRAGHGSFEYAAGRAQDAGCQHLRGADRRHQRDDVAPGAVPAHDGGLRVQPLGFRRGRTAPRREALSDVSRRDERPRSMGDRCRGVDDLRRGQRQREAGAGEYESGIGCRDRGGNPAAFAGPDPRRRPEVSRIAAGAQEGRGRPSSGCLEDGAGPYAGHAGGPRRPNGGEDSRELARVPRRRSAGLRHRAMIAWPAQH